MYSLNFPVSAIRTKIRQEFERHRFVAQLPVVDVLLMQGHVEYQVCAQFTSRPNSKQALSGVGRRKTLGMTGWSKFRVDMLQHMLTEDLMIGNAQLLEATAACPQVFQRYGRSHLKVAQQLHASIFRSKLSRG